MSHHPAGADDVQIPQMHWRLASKITLSIGSVLVVLALIVTIMTFVQVRQRAYADLELQAAALADALNFTFEVLVSQDKATTLQRVAENSATIPGVRKIVIVDRNQQVLASSNRLDLDTTLTAGPLRDFIAQRTPQRMTSLTEQNELVIMQPLRGGRFGGQKDGDIVGAIQVIEDTSGAEATARTTALQYLGVTLGSYLLLSLILAVILRLLVVRPVQQLAMAAQSFREGRRSQRSQLRRRDELGLLAATFDAMAEEVEQLVTGLEAQVAARTVALEQERTHLAMTLADLAEERALLAQRVAERTAELSAANAELGRAARLKDEFLASMSHELRTPLNSVLGLSESMQEEVYGPINDRQRQTLRHIEESGRHLLELINDILDLSKLEAGKLDLDVEEVVTAQVCQASLRLVKQTATQKRLTLSLNIDRAVTVLQADARRLTQMLINLLSNAVKFTPEGGAIGLDVVGDAAAGRVHLTVWDTGIGIAADDLPRLFQSFVQLDSRLAREYTGTGLGLALVQRMAVLHGGSVAVESRLGQGSRFTITFPWTAVVAMSDSVDSGDPAERPAVRSAIVQRALVIEDSPTAATLLTRYLHELGVAVSVHPCGMGALEAARDVHPDVILLDIQLPDRSGWDVLTQLKAEPGVRAIPVVVVSVVDDRPQGMALGAAAYLVKPIARQQLQETLATITAGGASQTAPPALLDGPEQPADPQWPIILLAEDDENNIRTLAPYLAAKGYQVVVAHDGAEAITQTRAASPNVIVMDIQMPGMDGLEAIRCIRADPTVAQVPIIALTALAMPGDRERCLAAGADDYLSKPVSLKGLVQTIYAHLHHPAPVSETIQ
jgi:signal transduction histidine kinase/DNA-binding response OmpR family regulator